MQDARNQNDWSLRDAAHLAGWAAQTQALFEAGDTFPSQDRIGGVARALGVSLSDELIARVTQERIWWAMTSSDVGQTGVNIVESVLPHMSEGFAQEVISRNYSTNNLTRRRQLTAPEFIVESVPSTWPRPVLVDAMCASIDTMHLGPNGMECILVGGKTVSINLSGHKEKAVQDSPIIESAAVTPPSSPTATPSVVTPPVATVSGRQEEALADFDAARKLVRESRSGACAELNPDMVNKQSLKM